MTRKPRIAFCISWQARTLDQTYLFFQKNLFNAAKEQWFDYDVYCAVEDDEDADKVNLLNPTKVEKIKSSDVEEIIKEKYWNFIDNEMYKYWYVAYTWTYSLLQQIYKLQRSIRMIKNIEYDLILRLRFDIIFLNKLNFNSIFERTKKWWLICNEAQYSGWMSTIAHHFIFSYHEISDIFFIWWNDMKIFGEIFDSFKNVVSNHKTYKIFMPVYKMISKMKCFVDTFNKKSNRGIFPLTPISLLARFFWLQVYVWESYYYKFLHGTKLYKIDICMILLRKKIEDSLVRLRGKTCFEI